MLWKQLLPFGLANLSKGVEPNRFHSDEGSPFIEAVAHVEFQRTLILERSEAERVESDRFHPKSQVRS